MSECEICGKPALTGKRARVEGAVFSVCDECAKLGEEMPVIRLARKESDAGPVIDEDYVLVQDFGARIKRARESMGMSHEELAGRIREKASAVRRAEHSVELEEKIMKKIGRALGVSLYERVKPGILKKAQDSPVLTLGDVATVRKRRA